MLLIKQGNNVIVITRCSNPDLRKILKVASKFGQNRILIGGLHRFNDFKFINEFDTIYPALCTRFICEI